MVIVRLNGGLGNQLFQYAAGFALSLRNNDILKLDVCNYSNDIALKQTKRNLDIIDFCLNWNIASLKEIETIKNPLGPFSTALRLIQKKIFKRYYVDWHPHIYNTKGNIYLDGYFQSEKYFSDYQDKLFEQFTLRPEILAEISNQERLIQNSKISLSIHIRRGDYVSNPKSKAHHLVCDVSYYQHALSRAEQLIPGAHIFVFSDDPKWVHDNIHFKSKVTFVSSYNFNGNTLRASQELYLMSRCQHHILSNSSFSWWGAYLNKSKTKIVLAPDRWNQGAIPQPNVLPQSWIRLPVFFND